MQRRKFLTITSGVIGMASLAGCSSLDGDDETIDTDGDGVVDSKDYAPRDPDVQMKEQVNPVTSTPRPTGNSTTSTDEYSDKTSTLTQTFTTATPKQEVSGEIQANYQDIKDLAPSYFKRYSPTTAVLNINTSLVDSNKLNEEMEILVIAQEYPNKGVIDFSRSQPFNPPDDEEIVIQYPRLQLPTDRYYYFTALLVPKGDGLDELSANAVTHLADTDRLTTENHTLKKATHPEAKESTTTDEYERVVGEGIYGIKTTGQHPFRILVYKSAHIQKSNKSFQQTITVIRDSIQNGAADRLAELVSKEAEQRDYTSSREKVNYAVASIQSFPYVKDQDNYDDYSKYPVETLVEGGGDCEDTTILLSATLSGKSFGYETALIWLPPENPTHIALGVKETDNIDGAYYTYENSQYYYVETTGRGWELGEIPSEYKNVDARINPISNAD